LLPSLRAAAVQPELDRAEVSEARSHLRASRRVPPEASGHRAAPPPSGHTEAREKKAGEIEALVHLAELDAALLDREEGRKAPVRGDVADQRHRLEARLSPEVLEAYERATEAGGGAPGGERVLRLPYAPALQARPPDPPAPGSRPVSLLPPAGVRPGLARAMTGAADEGRGGR
jgi:hypothetical protein